MQQLGMQQVGMQQVGMQQVGVKQVAVKQVAVPPAALLQALVMLVMPRLAERLSSPSLAWRAAPPDVQPRHTPALSSSGQWALTWARSAALSQARWAMALTAVT